MNCKCNAVVKSKVSKNVFCECQVEVPKGWRVCDGCQSGEHELPKFTSKEIREEIMEEINESTNQGLADIWNAIFPHGRQKLRCHGFDEYEKIDI